MTELHIASCVVRVRTDALHSVIAPIEAIIGDAISARDKSGRLVILLEGDTTGAMLDQMEKIRGVAGVLNVEMVYQHAEEKSTMEEIIQ
jgi:periplasmic nitrate reductase NapD